MKKKLTLLGAGTMGSGIAQLFAQCGFYVTLIDNRQSQLEKAKITIAKNLHYLVLTQNLPTKPSIETILASISFTTKLDELKHSEYIIENIPENWEQKKALYQVFNEQCSATCIFGVNTSSISITKIASLVENPQRVIGVHFMNPAPIMPMVEVIKGYHTDELTIKSTRTLLEHVHKKMIVVKDSAGFVSNRAMMIFINEAILWYRKTLHQLKTLISYLNNVLGIKWGRCIQQI